MTVLPWRGFEWQVNSLLRKRWARIVVLADSLPPAIRKAVETPIRGGVVRSGGCVLLKRFAGAVPARIRKQLGDRTAIEAFANHYHIEDYVERPGRELLSRFMACALHASVRLAQSLRDRLPRHSFELLLGGNSKGAHVRFHSSRRDERSAWAEDLEGFHEECAARLRLAAVSSGPS